MMKRAQAFGKKQFMRLGLEHAGEYKWMTYKHHCNLDRFRTYYGVTPRTCARLWHYMRDSNDPKIRLYKNANPSHLLLAIRFCWRYEREKELGMRFQIRSEKTVRKWVKFYLNRMRLLLPSFMADWDEAYSGLYFLFTVDGTHCPIEEPKPWSSTWSSHKLGGKPGVNYEIGLQIDKPQLFWLYGPLPAGTNDVSVFKQEFMPALEQFTKDKGVTVRGLGDKGYVGVPEFLSIRNDLDPEDVAEFKSRCLARHETFNQKLKMFASLDTRFRHGVEMHQAVFEAIVVLTLIQLATGAISLFVPYL